MKRLVYITLGLGLGTLGCGPAIAIDDTDDGSSSGDGDASSSTGVATTTTATTTPPNPSTGTTTLPPGTATAPTATDPTIGPGDSSSSTGFEYTTSSTSFDYTTSSTSFDPTGSSVTGFYTTGSSVTGDPMDLPDGANCTDDDQCLSGACYQTALGGFCGECNSDADCDFGCTQPNPIGPTGSVCNDGELGDGCETEDACADLECVGVVDVPGIFDISTCSECDVDGDCMPGQVCNIDFDAPGLTGVWTCVPTGTLGLGEICAHEASGDQACTSGFCAVASLKGLLEYGVCSQCESDTDCPGLETCSEPVIGLDGTVEPGLCM